MLIIKKYFNLLFLFFASHTVLVASSPARASILFRNFSVGANHYYHTDAHLQNWSQWKQHWQKFHKNVFGTHELPVLKEKDIEGFTVKQIQELANSEQCISEKHFTRTKQLAQRESELITLAKQAIKESNKKAGTPHLPTNNKDEN